MARSAVWMSSSIALNVAGPLRSNATRLPLDASAAAIRHKPRANDGVPTNSPRPLPLTSNGAAASRSMMELVRRTEVPSSGSPAPGSAGGAGTSCSDSLSIPIACETHHGRHIERLAEHRAAKRCRCLAARIAGNIAAHEHDALRQHGVVLLEPRVKLERGSVAQPDVDEEAIRRHLLDALLGFPNALRRVHTETVVLELPSHDHADCRVVVDVKHGWHLSSSGRRPTAADSLN